MLFPTGPKGDPDKDWGIIINDETRYIGILQKPDGEYGITVNVMDFIFQPLEGETPTTWQDNFKRFRFYNDESFYYYYEGLKKAFTDYSTISYDAIMGSQSVCTILQQIQNGKSITESIAKYKERIQALYDKVSASIN